MHAPKSLDDLQKMARSLGGVFTFLAAAMSGYAGWMFGGDSTFACIVLAALLAGLTVGVAIMLTFIDVAWTSGERGVAAALSVVFALAVVGEYASHVAFGTGHRAHNVEQAVIQTTRYDDTRAAVDESKTNLAFWVKRLADLESANAWSAMVTADALRAQARAEEMRGGCKTRCEGIKAKIAIAEEASELRKQIESTKRTLDKERAKSAETTKGDSIAMNQSQLFATAATGSLQPTSAAVAWANIGIGAYLSLLSTSLGAVFNWLGFHSFGNRRPTNGVNPVRAEPVVASAPVAAPVRPVAPAPAAPVGMSLATLVPQGARDKVLDVMTFADLKRLAAG
jgi:hypothetical protein